jgi:hypothetical protein
MAIPAESGPLSVKVTSMSESIAPSLGSSVRSFKNNPAIPHMAASSSIGDERTMRHLRGERNPDE